MNTNEYLNADENGNKKVMGRVKNAVIVEVRPGVKWVEGLVYGHPWIQDGTWFHTSKLVEIKQDQVETLNSLYNIESWDLNSMTL